MSKEKLSDEEIKEVFNKLKMPMDSSKKVGIWQVHPIKRGTKLFTETH